MSAEGMAFIAWICLMVLGAIIGTWVSKDERRRAREQKEITDAEYEEQQKLHEGDLTLLKEEQK